MEKPFRIEKMDSFQVIGYKIETTNQKQEGRRVIPEFWEKFRKQQLADRLFPLMDSKPYGILGVNVYNIDTDSRRFDYYIAAASTHSVPESMVAYTIPAATWAIFPCTPETIAKTEVQAIMKWLPKFKYKPINSGYITGRMKAGAPDIEYYGEDDYAEVWVAVRE